MASVNFHKIHSGSEAHGYIAHALREDRADGTPRERANKFIDPTETHNNTVVGRTSTNRRFSDRFDDSAESARLRLEKRVNDIDRDLPPKRIRKDRVRLMSYTIPIPDGISPADEDDFFAMVHDEIARMSGGRENISAGYIHRDEIHDYVDAVTGEIKTSRPHMHVFGIPYVEGKGVNAKLFETRERMKSLNNAIDDRCQKEFGVKFMTQMRGRSGRSVEDLQQSSELMAVRQERDRLTEELNHVKHELSGLRRDRDRMRDERDKAREERDAARAELQAAYGTDGRVLNLRTVIDHSRKRSDFPGR